MSYFEREAPYPSRRDDSRGEKRYGREETSSRPVRFDRNSNRGHSHPLPERKLKPIDRTIVSPILMRCYIFKPDNTPSDIMDYESKVEEATEIHLRTWLDSSLNDVVTLLKQVYTDFDDTKSVHFFSSHPSQDGKANIKKIGSVAPSASTTKPRQVILRKSSFYRGRNLYITNQL